MQVTREYVEQRDKIMCIIMFYNIDISIAFNLANDLMRLYHSDIPQYKNDD